MNLAVGIPAASAPTAAVPQSAAKTSTATAEQWQRAASRAMQGTDAQADVPQTDGEKTAQPASADKSTSASTATDPRARKAKASSGKTEAERRKIAHQVPAAGANVVATAPYLLQVAATAAAGSGTVHATQKSAKGAAQVTRAAGDGHTAANADTANSQAPLAAMNVQTQDPSQSLPSASALPQADPKTLQANVVHSGAEDAAHAAQTEAASNIATSTSVQAQSLAGTATPGTTGAATLPLHTQSDRDAGHAANAQAADPAPVTLRVASGRSQKPAAGLASTLAGTTNYSAVAAGAAATAQAANPAAVALNHAAGEAAAGSNQNVLHQLGGQVQELYQGGGGQTTVQLSPPALGSVQVHVQVQPNHGVSVSFVASQPQAVQLIQAGIPFLTQALQQNHLQLAQAQVSLANTAGGAGTASGQQGSAFQQPGGSANNSWHGGALAPQGRDAASEPAPADTQGVMAYA